MMATTRLNAASFAQQRFSFSSDTHSDFAPKRKEVDGVDEAMKLIKEHVEGNPIMVRPFSFLNAEFFFVICLFQFEISVNPFFPVTPGQKTRN